jgi:predicted alpha/beta hydrolase family esterase
VTYKYRGVVVAEIWNDSAENVGHINDDGSVWRGAENVGHINDDGSVWRGAENVGHINDDGGVITLRAGAALLLLL